MRIMRIFAVMALVGGVSTPVAAEVPLKSPTEPVPSAVGVGMSEVSGPIYTTSSGMTLYSTDLDERKEGVLGCTDKKFEKGQFPLPRAEFRKTCVDRWPPFYADAAAQPVGRWNLVARPDGRKQWSYDKRPLYLSTRDKVAGEVNGTMGFERHEGWRTVAVPRRMPPGLKLVRKLDGLMLGDITDRLVFTPTSKSAANNADFVPVEASELDLPFDEWTVTTRPDGIQQWAYNKKPLYRPKDIAHISQNVASGKWQPIVIYKSSGKPKAITLHMTVPEIGWVYADPNGKTLYMMTCNEQALDRLPCDEVGDPASYWSAMCGTAEQCAQEWRPLLAAASEKPVGPWKVAQVPSPPFKEVTGAYGVDVPTVSAWTFYGRPVYTFRSDKAPGEALGHSIRGVGSEMGAIAVLGDSFPIVP